MLCTPVFLFTPSTRRPHSHPACRSPLAAPLVLPLQTDLSRPESFDEERSMRCQHVTLSTYAVLHLPYKHSKLFANIFLLVIWYNDV